jgi:outer membrane protein assembly factor BamB
MPRLPVTLLLLVCTTSASAGDWPQWLGPRRDASTSEKVAPWKDKLKVVWRQPVGEGNSSPVVAEGRVFIHAKIKDKNEEEVVAYDTRTGKELWRTPYPRAEFQSFYGNGPRGTPAVVEGKVYTFGITGVLACFEADKGKIVWQVDTIKEFNAPKLMFGMAGSPLVEGDKVLVNVGAKGASIVAFDRNTGKVVWKARDVAHPVTSASTMGLLSSPRGQGPLLASSALILGRTRDDKASYSSPIAFGEGKSRQVVFLTAKALVSLNPADGSTYWEFPLVDRLLESSTTPIHAGNILLGSSITYGSVGLRLETKDDKPSFKEEWKNKELTSYFSTPVPMGKDHIYIVTGKMPNPLAPRTPPSATLHCIEAKAGKILWSRPKVGEYHASLMRTGDDKLLLLEEAGDLVLMEPSPKEYKELARAKVSGKTWAHPALADGLLYLRDEKDVLCVQLGAK